MFDNRWLQPIFGFRPFNLVEGSDFVVFSDLEREPARRN